MLKNRTIWLAVISAFALPMRSARAENGAVSGLYQITSGRYLECCGFVGIPTSETLPSSRQAFVELTINPTNNLAQMRFLGQDMRTVFSTPIGFTGNSFVFSFANGTVFPDHIVFGTSPDPQGPPGPPYYVISNSADALRLNGTVDVSCPGCADLPTHFAHTNVTAILMPTTTLRVSEVEFCWNSASNRTYQVQYQPTATTNTWKDLGSPVTGNGGTNCIKDAVLLSQPERLYRVLTLP